MLHIIAAFMLGITIIIPAQAWEQHKLPTAYTDSSTPHYGGNKAPRVYSASHIQIAAPDAAGIRVWDSPNDGITWSGNILTTNTAYTNTYLASSTQALAWGDTATPTIFFRANTSDSWHAATHAWPLPHAHIMHVGVSSTGDMQVLATTPQAGKLVEGALYMVRGSVSGWQQPVLISGRQALVGDATWVEHGSGLQSVVWSERNANHWQINLRNSNDNITWGAPLVVEPFIAAPYFQEAAVHIAADALNHNEIALAFTGWHMQPHSQVWSKAVDAVSGITTQAAALLPDARDMVLQPSLVTLGGDTWAVAWQQKIGLDSEIYVAQHHANGTWSHAVNVSMDPMHMDRDPHIAKGASKTLNIAFTRRVQADVQEVYMFAEGDIADPSLDSDGDGIPDAQEQGQDINHDGIDDAQSARVATWRAEDGRYALIVLDNGELRQVQALALYNTTIATPATHDISGGLFAFQIHALQSGETTRVHVLSPHTLAADATWLKLNPNAQWSDSESNTVFLDASGKGLVVSLTDGGAGDEDGVQNGVIVDPAAIATPHKASVQTSLAANESPSSQAASCVAPQQHTLVYMLLLTMLALGFSAKRQQHH